MSSSSARKPNLPQISEKLRFLCLHGYRQNADGFKGKIGSFRKSVQKYAEFVFVSAPHIALPLDPEDPPNDEQRSWWTNREDGSFSGKNRSGPAGGFEESVALVEKVWQEQGPFQGLLGFSQGGCFVGLLCSLAARGMTKINPQYAIVAAGFCSGSLVHLAYYEEKIPTQSLHIMGTTDEIIPHEMSKSLAEHFEGAKIILHSGGHYFAASVEQKPMYVETFQDWLQEHLEAKELRRNDVVEVNGVDDGIDVEEENDEKKSKRQTSSVSSTDDSS